MTKRDTSAQLAAARQCGFDSLAAAGERSCQELRNALGSESCMAQAQTLLESAREAHDEAMLLEKRVLTHVSPLLPRAIGQKASASTQGYLEMFGERALRYVPPGDVASRFSPAAYLVELFHNARALYRQGSPWHIDSRRPDLRTLVLSNTNLDTPVSALTLSNEILLSKAGQAGLHAASTVDADEVLRTLSADLGSCCTPYHHHYSRLRAALAHKDPAFTHFQAAPTIFGHLHGAARASLHHEISPGLRSLLLDPVDEANAELKFAEYFPRKTPESMLTPGDLRAWFGLSDEELQRFMRPLDEPAYVDGSVMVRVGDRVVRMTARQSKGWNHFASFYVFPKGDGQWELQISFKSVSYNNHLYELTSLNGVGVDGARIDAKAEGDERFVVGKTYRTQFSFPYADLPETFVVNSRRWQTGGGQFSYSHAVQTEWMSPALYLLRLNKMVRLYKATQHAPRVLEDILDSAPAGQIDEHCLSLLAHTAELGSEYAVSHEQALIMAKGLISVTAPPGEKSQFDRLFNDPPLVGEGLVLDDTVLPLDPAQGDEHADTLATLKRACQTDDEGLHALGACLGKEGGASVKLDLNEVSALYALSLWAHLHGLSPIELRQLLQMIGLPEAFYEKPSDVWLEKRQALAGACRWLDARGWRVGDLLLMTREVDDIPASAEILNLQRAMKAALDAAELPDPLTPEACSDVLAPLVASSFGLAGQTAAQAVLTWADRAQPGGLGLVALCEVLLAETPDADPVAAAVAFSYGLAQMALVVHASGVGQDLLKLLVSQPHLLGQEAVQTTEAGATLKRSLHTVKGLAGFSDWLKRLPDPEAASGALLAALEAGTGIPLDVLAKASSVAPVALAQAAIEAKRLGDIAHDTKADNWCEIEVLSQWLALAGVFGVMPADIGRMIALDYAGTTPVEASWEAWAKVTNAFLAGLTPTQTLVLEAATQAPLSQALAGFVSVREGIGQAQLDQRMLADSGNGPQVMTSRIAEAISALQQFIHRCLSQPESATDLNTDVLDRQFFRDWTRWNARYATWAAGQLLTYYPENYIDPTVRLGQTQAMDDMLQALGQAQINNDTVGDAFQGYLNAFEEVADLETISGYQDSRDAASGKTWFVGRSRGNVSDYWWRTADESKRSAEGVLPANAWSSWNKVTLTPQVHAGLIRPVVYRQRFYLGWVEREEQIIARDDRGQPSLTLWRWSFKLSWQRYDGSWSAPQDYPLEMGSVPDQARPALFLTARPERNTLMMGIYDRRDSQSEDRTLYSGLEIAEDLRGTPVDIRRALQQVPHWLDTQQSTRMCAVFGAQGRPLVESELETPPDDAVPGRFTRFDAVLNQVQVVPSDEPDDSKYRLHIDTSLMVNAKWTAYANRWASTLTTHYPELSRENRQLPMLLRAPNGACMLRKDGKQNWVYLCWDAKDFAYGSDVASLYDPELPDEPGAVVKLATPEGDVFCGKYRVKYTAALWHLEVCFRKSDGQRIPAIVQLGHLVHQPLSWNNPALSPQEHLPLPEKMAAADVTCTVLRVGGSNGITTEATQDLVLDAGSRQVDFKRITAAVGNTDEWNGADEAVHVVRYQCGDVHFRDYWIRVYRGEDSLQVAVIGSTSAGAQYLERDNRVTRLNTLFARQLTERAVSGLDTVLTYDTQKLEEPAIGISMRLTLPVYKASYHGKDRMAKVWVARSANERSLLWAGRLSDSETTEASVTLATSAMYGATGHYYLETQYQRVHHKGPQQSIIVDGRDLKVLLSSDVGMGATPKLSKDNVDSVQVLPREATAPMDFSGANALYFWELFYYAPMMVMQRFLQEERFDLAEQWLKYIFNPAGYTVGGEYTPRIWNVRPLEEDRSWNDQPLRSIDPDAVAQNDPMHYKVNAFMRLLDITIGRGDAAYRKLERDTLSEARVWYERALALLGNAPWTPPPSDWSDPTLGEMASEDAIQRHLDALESLLGARAGIRGVDAQKGFLPEANQVMLGYWETLRLRVYNLRNNLTLDGQPLTLPLYASAADPKALLAAAVAAQAGGEGQLPEQNAVPALRFPVLLDGARTMVSQLIAFGHTLQGILERQDAEALAGLLTAQGAELANSNVALFTQRLQEIAAERVTLEKSLEGATLRRDHYRGLFEQHLTPREQHCLEMQTTAQALVGVGAGLEAGGILMRTFPTIFGLANGGAKIGAPLIAKGKVISASSHVLGIVAARLSQEEIYRRRRNDWEFQSKTAEKERAVILAQLDALGVRETSARMHLAHLKTQSAHAQAQLDLHQNKFTGTAMYSWLRTRLASIFYTYYDLTVTRCAMAQKALQWEMADTATYLRTGTWNGAWAGLMCGEGLMLALGQMDTAWTKWQKREMEVTRTRSLANLMKGKLTVDAENVTLGEAIKALIAGKTVAVAEELKLAKLSMVDGTLSIQVGLESLDLGAGFEQSASRRVRSIAVSLPCLTGTYQDVHGRLITNATGLAPGCHECAISHAVKDNGLFSELNGYPPLRPGTQLLPFEGLKIPKADDADQTLLTLNLQHADGDQKALLQSLNDIILHVQFTVR